MTSIASSDDNVDYITQLENKVQELRNEVRRLKSDNRGGKSSKDELRKTYRWTEDDLMFSDQVIRFSKEYLFPRFKFLKKGWMKYGGRKENSFSTFVKKRLPIRRDKDFASEWDQIIAPTIVKKYTDMRCNLNNDVRTTFLREYYDPSFNRFICTSGFVTFSSLSFPSKSTRIVH